MGIKVWNFVSIDLDGDFATGNYILKGSVRSKDSVFLRFNAK